MWPRLRSARSPCSVSSRATISAFISQERRTAWSRAAASPSRKRRAVRLQPARRSRRRRAGRTSPPRRSRRGSRAAAACRGARCRRAPAAAGGRRRSGSCPGRELIPVLPPTELSTWASSVVGTCTKPTPRRSTAAAKPARSPITPPPKATHQVVAADLLGDQPLDRRARAPAQPLVASPGGSASTPPRSRPRRARRASAGRCSAATRASVSTATRGRRRSGRDLGARPREQARADADVVGARAERHGDGLGQVGCGLQGRARGRASPRSWARDRGDDRARHRLVAGAAAAVDDDVGLGVDRASGGGRGRRAPPRGSGACSSGRPGRSRTRSQSRSRSARIQTEVARALISARVRGSMKAPPPVASTPGRSAEQPRDHPPLAVAEGRLAEGGEDLGDRSCRRRRRSRRRSR